MNFKIKSKFKSMESFELTFAILILMTACSNSKKLAPAFTPEEMAEARNKALDCHNIFRTWHDTPQLILNEELNDHAQAYAENLIKLDKFEHDKNKKNEGENLFKAGGSAGPGRFNPVKKARGACEDWYEEICDPKWEGKTSHFTQLIWKASKQLGVGIAQDDDNSTLIVVARYSPQGNFNYGTTKGSNVLPLRCSKGCVCKGKKLVTLEKGESYKESTCTKGCSSGGNVEAFAKFTIMSALIALLVKY